jgi:hypothetical protein
VTNTNICVQLDAERQGLANYTSMHVLKRNTILCYRDGIRLKSE